MSKQNPPSAKAYTKAGSDFKGWRKSSKHWRKGEPLIEAKGVCRRALNEAIISGRDEDADHIAKQPHRRLYSWLSKPDLTRLLARIADGYRLSTNKKYWPDQLATVLSVR